MLRWMLLSQGLHGTSEVNKTCCMACRPGSRAGPLMRRAPMQLSVVDLDWPLVLGEAVAVVVRPLGAGVRMFQTQVAGLCADEACALPRKPSSHDVLILQVLRLPQVCHESELPLDKLLVCYAQFCLHQGATLSAGTHQNVGGQRKQPQKGPGLQSNAPHRRQSPVSWA